MKISIIVPVYNVEKYIRKCLDSILNQTFKEFELILVNDGSIDNSGKICDEYALKDKRIKVIHKKNGGLSSARNAGLDVVRGEYIGFVDSDDWIEPNMYELLYKVAKFKNADIVACNYSQFKEKNKLLKKDGIYLNKIEEIELEKLYEHILEKKYPQIYWSAWNKLWKRDLIGNLRFKEGRIYEDKLFLYEIIYRNNEKKIYKINDELYHYRIDNISITRSIIGIKNLDYLKNIIDIYKVIPSKYRDKIFIEDFLYGVENLYLKIVKEKNILKSFYLIKSIKKIYEENEYTIKNANILKGYKKYKFFILIKIPLVYIIFKRITKRY